MNLRERIRQYNRIDEHCCVLAEQQADTYSVFLPEVLQLDRQVLQEWMQDRNATVIAYAFWALAKLGSPHLEDLLLSFQADQRTVTYCVTHAYRDLLLTRFMLDIAIQESLKQKRSLVSDRTIAILQSQSG